MKDKIGYEQRLVYLLPLVGLKTCSLSIASDEDLNKSNNLSSSALAAMSSEMTYNPNLARMNWHRKDRPEMCLELIKHQIKLDMSKDWFNYH